MLHYHGTPITPRATLHKLAGSCFCVSFEEPRDVAICHQIGQSVMLDNGAYTAWTQGRSVDFEGFAAWARPWLEHPTTWAVIPDVIDGDEDANDALITSLFADARDVWSHSAPVWHMHESLERLSRLCLGYGRVCIGSSGAFRVPGSSAWTRRMDEAFNQICGNGPVPCWLHMLRAMDRVAGGPWPFASADSTNVARNHAGSHRQRPRDPAVLAREVDARQAPGRWTIREHTMEMVA